jgi:hypothetical protein
MTFRDVARRYLGWCPGFNRVIDYPLRENLRPNFKLITASVAVVLALSFTSLILLSPPYPISPGSPLQIYIRSGPKKGVYLDSSFNQTFDYSAFYDVNGNGLSFFDPINTTEYASAGIDVSTYKFATLDEVYNSTTSLSMPNAIRQYIRWLIAQDFNSTNIKEFGKPVRHLEGLFGNVVGIDLATGKSGYTRYIVMRSAQYGGVGSSEDYTRQLMITDGVEVQKYSGTHPVWYLGIDGCAEGPYRSDPRYTVRIVHYPQDFPG